MNKDKTEKKVDAMKVWKYVAVIILCVIQSQSTIVGARPFGVAFALSLIFCGFPFVAVAPALFVGEMIASPNLFGLLYSGGAIIAAIIGRIVLLKTSKAHNATRAGFAVLAQMGLIYACARGQINFLQAVIWGVVGIGSTLLFCGFVTPVIVEKMRYKLLTPQLIACACLVSTTALGLSGAQIGAFPIVGIFVSALILLSCYIGGMGASLVCALALGVGRACFDYNIAPIAAFAFMALLVGIFSSNRILGAMTAILGYVMFMFFFNVDYSGVYMMTASLLVGAVAFLLVRKKTLDNARRYIGELHVSASARDMLNRTRYKIGNKIKDSGQIFAEMSEVISEKIAIKESYGCEIEAKVCADCPNYLECKELSGFREGLENVMHEATDAGRASVANLPSFLSENCAYLGRIMGFVSKTAEKMREVKLRRECLEGARLIVAEQLSGMAKTLNTLGQEVARKVNFDSDKEKLLVEELNYCGVFTTEALVSGDDITIIARNETFSSDIILAAAARIMRYPCILESADADALAGFTIASLARAPRLDVVFAVSALPKRKGEPSGDAHSFIRINSHKFMMALCDGMGSGAEAEKVSDMAISLVESFYKVGLDSDLALTSVNKFLSLTSADRFATIDICIIDLNSGDADIIKLASPSTVIKGKDKVVEISGSSLPMGVVSDVSPSLSKVRLKAGEMALMFSDGVTDSFGETGLLTAVNNLQTVNPSIMADGIMEHALSLNRGALKDDTTVLCARVFERL